MKNYTTKLDPKDIANIEDCTGGGGEPAAYLKSASVDGNTLKLVNKNDAETSYTPDLSAYRTSAAQDTIDEGLQDNIDAIINDTLESATTTWSSNELKTKFAAITGITSIRVVDVKPTTPTLNTLYYVGTAAPYEIWLWAIKEGGTIPEWFNFGSTSIELSNYYTKEQAEAIFYKKSEFVSLVQNVKSFDLTIAAGGSTAEQVLPNGYVYFRANAFANNKEVIIDIENDVTNNKIKFSISKTITSPISIKLFAIKNPDKEFCPYVVGQVYETLNSDETIETLAARFEGTTWEALPDRLEFDDWKSVAGVTFPHGFADSTPSIKVRDGMLSITIMSRPTNALGSGSVMIQGLPRINTYNPSIVTNGFKGDDGSWMRFTFPSGNKDRLSSWSAVPVNRWIQGNQIFPVDITDEKYINCADRKYKRFKRVS